MTARCVEMEFSLYGEEGGDMVEGVATFKYLGQNLDQNGNDWTAVRQNIIHTRLVWGRLGTMLGREEA